MSKLILDSLEIKRFRPFEHLTISKFGRVNLIVGKNNVGKSSVLEAIELYANRGNPRIIWDILETHDEDLRGGGNFKISLGILETYDEDLREGFNRIRRRDTNDLALSSLKFLYYGREEIRPSNPPILIGPIDKPDETLALSIGFFARITEEDGASKLQRIDNGELEQFENPIPRITTEVGKQLFAIYSLNASPSPSLVRSEIKDINYVYMRANGLTKRTTAELWDTIALTVKESRVLDALSIITPGVEDIHISSSFSRTREPSIRVKIRGVENPMAIRSLGDGMQRMLGIALALVNAENGILLIDEIENGLHYSAQTDLWRFIFEIAQSLNIQVFATTHSLDCMQSFNKAAAANDQEEGYVIRLENKGKVIKSVVIDERRLNIATREQIELR